MKPAKLLFRMPKEASRDKITPDNAQDVVVDEAVGHIYVTSYGYQGVLVYDMEGKLQFGIRKDGVGGDDKFNSPKSVKVGVGGNIYVTDYFTPEISVFDFSGRPAGKINVDVTDIANGQKAKNYGLAFDKDGNIYVTDPVSNSIQILDPKGKRLYYASGVRTEDEAKKTKSKQLFNGPSRLTLTNDGDIVFIDAGYQKLMVYGADGKFKRSIGKPGANAGEMYFPTGITTGSKGEILVASGESPNIQAFSPDGKFLYALCNEKGDGPLDISTVRGICIDSKNRLYVAEGVTNRVSVFQIEDRTIDIVPQK
jgi:DNA-binding beta-propeller fold protein YncE